MIKLFSADKEKLADDRFLFDKLLHDASLSSSQILRKMGITTDLEANGGKLILITLTSNVMFTHALLLFYRVVHTVFQYVR